VEIRGIALRWWCRNKPGLSDKKMIALILKS
jgi:hypothetical protein